MTDFCDAASDLSDYHLALSLRQHANRKHETELPICTHCEEYPVHVTGMGSRFKYCYRCTEELTGRKV